mgnify:CR=1 FL=1
MSAVDVIRECIWRAPGVWHPEALAALDALVAERDEANVQWHKIRDLHADAVSEVSRLQAELVEWKATVNVLMNRAEAELVEWKATVKVLMGERTTAEARVTELEAALRTIAEAKERVPVTGTTGITGRARYTHAIAARSIALAVLAAPTKEDTDE